MAELFDRGFLLNVGTLGSVVKKHGLTWKQFVKRRKSVFPGPKSTCYKILKDIKEF
jgi:hypothetical protein